MKTQRHKLILILDDGAECLVGSQASNIDSGVPIAEYIKTSCFYGDYVDAHDNYIHLNVSSKNIL